MLIVNYKKSLLNAREPMYATKGAACFDLFAADVVTTEPKNSFKEFFQLFVWE